MRILITGGYGYLGGRLAQFLATQINHEILLASRQKTKSPNWLPQAKVVLVRWNFPDNLDEICSDVDVIVHLAGMNAQDCGNDPVVALDVNAVATARLLHSAVRQKVKRFIYLSTAHVYASPLVGTISEDTCPVNLHPYATSHRAGEDVVRAAQQHGEIDGVVIRLSNAYGAPAHKEANCWMLLVNDLCRQVVMMKNLVLYSAGQQRRDFITLTDTVRAINYFIQCPSAKLSNGIFNLGGECSLRIVELAGCIAERSRIILGFEPSIKCLDADPCGISQPLEYRIDKLLGTGFRLKGNIDDEIDGTLKFCLANFEVGE